MSKIILFFILLCMPSLGSDLRREVPNAARAGSISHERVQLDHQAMNYLVDRNIMHHGDKFKISVTLSIDPRSHLAIMSVKIELNGRPLNQHEVDARW